MVKKKNVIKREGNIVVLKDLGIYSEDPEQDKKINEDLSNFLKSKDYPRPKIKPINPLRPKNTV